MVGDSPIKMLIKYKEQTLITPLTKQLQQANHKYLVFTSAGDNSNLPHWLKGNKNFDLWISYFGDQQNKFSDVADYYMMRKGGKFPVLHYAYQQWSQLLKQYDAIFVLDDDLIFSATDITRLFKIREQHDLWLLQPAFDKRGKISFKLNEVHPFSLLRYSNFVEVACPLFTTEKLINFMDVYDPNLIGWGVDFWFSEQIAKQDENNSKIAIIDLITCINPRDEKKIDNKREIDQLQSRDDRIATWEAIKQQYKLSPDYQERAYGQIRKIFSLESLIKSIRVLALKYSYIGYKKLTGGRIYPIK